jgi:hypothetical protein
VFRSAFTTPARRLITLLMILTPALPEAAHAQKPGVRLEATPAVRVTTAQLMAQKPASNPSEIEQARRNWEPRMPGRDHLPQARGAAQRSSSSIRVSGASQSGLTRWRPVPLAPQSLGTSFTAGTLADAHAFPPDCEGTVGPTQFVLFINGLIRSFNKTTGTMDGVLDVSPEGFFLPVMTPVSPPVVLNFTSDPQVRYDRLSARWFMSIIDVPCKDNKCSKTAGNRWLLAVSDAASAGVITPSTVWALYFFQGDPFNFLDYPSLGVDANALYIGGNMFDSTGTQFLGTNGYVVNKASALNGGPISVTEFAGMTHDNSSDGPDSPRGVDNYDPSSNEGYFIGNSNLFLGSLVVRRISNPGGSPTISPNIPITVDATAPPIPVAHLGNTGGLNGRLSAIDDRLFAAHIRGGRLWTAHNIGVTAAGVAGGTGGSSGTMRDAVRWYELSGIRSTDNGGVPLVVESGTIFDTSATVATARQFWIPSAMVSGQGHAALGFSTAGTLYHADAATAGRLNGDAPGTTEDVSIYTSSGTAYNPVSDPGDANGRRWGDYSFTTLDPLDDMTMWTVQEFCDATNSYGCRAVKLIAPPPATPASALPVAAGRPSAHVVLTGTSVAGSGFFDPGPDLASPALPFHHLAAIVTNTGVTGNPPTVNAATFVDPTHVQLDLNTSAADPNLPGQKYTVVVTNPDGQMVSGPMVLEVDAAVTAVETSSSAFEIESVIPNPTTGATRIGFTVAFASQVRLSVVDVQGREIAVLADGVLSAGQHEAQWNGRRGSVRAPAGIYFIRFRAGGVQRIRRLAMMR